VKFNYQARTQKGEVQTGIVEASSKEAALNLLQGHGLVITLLEKSEEVPFYAKKIKFFERISQKDIVNFSRQLSLMFKSRIPLIQALQTIAEQTKNSSFREKITTISQEVEGGTPFSQALSHYPKLFSSFYVSMVRSGEASGTLSESLGYLADHLEREYFLLSKIKGAMIYPILILVVVIGVLVMMIYFVIPQLSTVFETSGQELPLLTKIVLALSTLARKFGWLLLILFVGLVIAFFRYIKTPAGKRVWDKTLLRIPLIGSFLKMIYLSRFAENLSTLVRGGLPISQALEITSDIVGNQTYREVIFEIRDEVRRGEKISGQLKEHPELFPPILAQMVMVGEKTGTLDQSLMNVVEFYQKEINRSIDNLLSILEPVMVLFLGLIVAVLMAAVLMPIYRMTSI
jgi:type IV pilus assembly protein PilC